MAGFGKLHPLVHEAGAQGALQVMFELERDLAESSGMAGAPGEFPGLLMIRAHQGPGRTEVLIPDSAHGTNPATCRMLGFRRVQVKTGKSGGVDIEDMKRRL